jgi:hypothetical protein
VRLTVRRACFIELTGFATNDKAGQAYNLKVAMNRAEEAAEFLLRRQVDDSQILINPAQVVGKMGAQLDSDRRVEAKLLEQLSDNYQCRMVTWKDLDTTMTAPELKDLDPGKCPALVITGNDIYMAGYFYMVTNPTDTLIRENRFTPIPPAAPGGLINPSEHVSINDFDGCGAYCTMLPATDGFVAGVKIVFDKKAVGSPPVPLRARTIVFGVDSPIFCACRILICRMPSSVVTCGQFGCSFSSRALMIL